MDRFLEAQNSTFDQVLFELRAGYKRTHWMWFIFPQISGLGTSSTSEYYSLHSISEARFFLKHSLLGSRLIECTDLVNNAKVNSARMIFGTPDDLKFHASMTLFSIVQPNEIVFSKALSKYFGDTHHELTLKQLSLNQAEKRRITRNED